MDNIKQVIAKNLIKYRKAAKMTQLELAELLMYSDKNISKWERGEAVPDIIILKQLADMYHISVNDFLVENQEPLQTNIQPEDVSNKKKIMNKKQVLISLLSVSLVWLVATICFCFFINFSATQPYAWRVFILAIPITMIVLLVFTSIWCTNLMNAIVVALLIWTSALAIFVCLNIAESWLIFIVAVPLQILDVLWFVLKKHNKVLKFQLQQKKDKENLNKKDAKSDKKNKFEQPINKNQKEVETDKNV